MPETFISRSGVETLIPEDYSPSVFSGAIAASQVLTLGRRLANMSSQQRRISVTEMLPIAYFNNAGGDQNDISFKRSSEVRWKNKFIDAEEISVIIPIAENVLNDAGRDLWADINPLLNQAFGQAIDAAVFHGINAPNIWPDAIVPSASAAGNGVTLGTGVDLYDDLLGENGTISKLEEDGYMATGHAAVMRMRGKLRGLRDKDGQPIFKTIGDMQGATNYQLDGEPIFFSRNGGLDPSLALLISGDWEQLLYAFRQDITIKILTEAVIQNPVTKAIVYNLAQQDMVALRAVMRLGWQIPNPINPLNTDEDSRYPFSVLFPQGVS